MATEPAYVASPPPLTGRDAALDDLLALAASRPGVVVVTGPPGIGRSRLVREAAARLAMDGTALIDARAPGPPADVLAGALADAGHGRDPARAARLRPIVILLGERGDEPGLAAGLAGRLAGSRGVVLMTGRELPTDVPALALPPLAPDDALALVRAAAPGLAPAPAAAVADLGDGVPGRLIALAHAARDWPGGDAPLPLPAGLRTAAEAALAPLDARAADLARWAALLREPFGAGALARVTLEAPARIAAGLESLTTAGVLEEVPGPPEVRWRFRDRVLRAVAEAGLGGAERRRRHAAALVAARAAGEPAGEIARHAVGAADAGAVVVWAVRAAAAAHEDGDLDGALAQADRALAWWGPGMGESVRLAALHERGMALLDRSAWPQAAEALEEAARGRRELGERDAALASISAASSARWILGKHDQALRALQDHLTRSRDPAAPPSAARAEALTHAAGMAVMTSRFSDAMAHAGEARSEATAAGADDTSTRALIFMGMAESGRGGPGGLLHLARARREGERAGGPASRNATLAMIHESHVLLAVGRPADAAACARDGIVRARELGLREHELVLTGNLGEALAASGALPDARRELEAAAAGWAELEGGAHTPAEPGMAWLLLAEGRIEDALSRHRALSSREGPVLFEQVAPIATGHALAALAGGGPEEAALAVSRALEAWARTDDRLTAIPLLAVGAEALAGDGAARCVTALTEMDAAGIPLAGPASAYARGMVARGGRGAARHLRAAADGYEALELRWWAARARFAAGLADGRSDAAAEDLLAARRAFRAMGADGWRRRAEARLRAIGRRIPTRSRPPTTPGAGLSARELEVLAELALGLRNRDIGERLFISERTVARHLVQINAKLGVTNRTAAVRVAQEMGLLSPRELGTTP
ncbi:MAG TPA: LuxR C-terminal-related transcriptional regulator [Miltoncostaea sp.]|nr:LuxR C-terminal-related transcriptional regulator [Miltoncostaea sp.]